MDLKIKEEVTLLGETRTYENTYTADGGAVASPITFANSTTNKEIDLPVDISTVEWVLIECDQNVTLVTNSSGGGEGTETLAIKANKPFVWKKEQATTSYVELPLEVDVTKWYLSGTVGGTLRMTFGLNVTP